MKKKDALFVYSVIFRFHFSRKLVFFALVYYLSRLVGFGVDLTLRSFLGFLAFFIAYSSIYFINDLLDHEFDRKRKNMTYPKPLAMEIATPRDYINLSYLHSITGLTLCFLFSRPLGVLTFLTLLTAHIRHYVKPIIPRTFLLGILEYLNFLSIASAYSLSLTDPRLNLLFAVVSIFYAFLYLGYRVEKISGKAISMGLIVGISLFLPVSIILQFPIQKVLILILLAALYSTIWYVSVKIFRKDWFMSLVQFAGALILIALA